MKGLTVDVYRGAEGFDGTAGGPSGRFKGFTLIGDEIPPVHAVHRDRPAIILKVENGHPRLVPLEFLDPRKVHTAFGGNFGWSTEVYWTSILRAHGLPEILGPIKIFDHVIR